MDRIDLVDMTLDCILGVLDSEQRRAQPLVGALSMWLDLDEAGETGRLDRTVDYATVAAQVAFIAAHGRFRLLESMSLAMLRQVLLPPAVGEERAAVQRARLRLRKPEILGDLATPGTVFERDAAWAARRRVVDLGGGVRADVVVDTGREGVWRLHLDPSATWDPGKDRAVHVVAGRIARDNRVTVGRGTSVPENELGPVRAGPEGAALLVVRVPPPP